MKQIKLHYLFITLALATILASCHKDKEAPAPETPTAERAGIYILNQGNYGAKNTTLTYYDYTTKALSLDLYASANNSAKIGDTGNDIGIYGSKMYIVVNNSNVVNIVNAKTAKLIKQDSMIVSKGVGRFPRSVAFYKSNAFVTSYDGTVAVIDTVSLAITKYITVGRNPEQMVIANGKLYVANSGGLSYGNPDKTVSVIDLATLIETKKLTVIADPVSLSADTYGNVYVLSLGDFSDPTIKGGLSIIDYTTDVVKSTKELSLGYNIPIYTQGDFVYYPTADNKIAVYNAKTQTSSSANFITDGTAIASPYAISGDERTGEIFITDAKDYSSNGTLTAFDKTGKKEYTINTGISPGKVILVNK
jgi:YVTN family beta-propeller protein